MVNGYTIFAQPVLLTAHTVISVTYEKIWSNLLNSKILGAERH